MNRGTMICISKCNVFVNEVTRDVENTSEHLFADRNRDGFSGIREAHSTLETVRGGHRNGAHPAITEVLLNFENQLGINPVENIFDLKRVVDFRQFAGFGEISVDDGADDLDDGSLVAHGGRSYLWEDYSFKGKILLDQVIPSPSWRW